jgi:hypothetical protein
MAPLETRIQKRLHVSLYALLFLTALLGLSVVLEGCTDQCETTAQYVYFEPVYTPIETIRASVEVTNPKPVSAMGRIYFKDDYLFINEPGEGIHVIDNHDPRAPKPVKFISIPGNFDLAINDNILFADSYVDLLSLDISDLNNVRVVGRKNYSFSFYNALGFEIDPAKGVVTSWKRKEQNFETSACDVELQPWGGFYYEDGIALTYHAAESFNSKAAIAPGTGSGPGLGGSLARMTINEGQLFTLNGFYVKSIDIHNPTNLVAVDSLQLNWDIETIFPYQDKLFVGARSGMYIVDVSTPSDPDLISFYSHVVSCDPVVVSDDYAYVTLRSDNMTCTGLDNRLEIIDISNLTQPSLVASYAMTNPHGLGIDQTTLFVCDGRAGLKVFNVTDKMAVHDNLLAHHPFVTAFDVIPYNNVLMMIGAEGLYQYDYSNKKDLKLLSHISVKI